MTSRARSCSTSPRGPASTNESPRSQANIASPSSSPMASRISPSVTKRAWAATSSAMRWRGLGASATKLATRPSTTSGTALEVERRAGARGVALGEDVHQQRQRERVPVGQLDGPVAEVGGHAGAGEHGPRVLGLQVAQGHDAQQVAPAGVPAPRLAGARAAGDDGHRPRRHGRDEVLAQPVLQPQRLLEGVEEQHRPVALGQRRRHRRAGREAHRARRARPRTRAGPGRSSAGPAARRRRRRRRPRRRGRRPGRSCRRRRAPAPRGR